MPTVHRFGPYRSFFWAHENQETHEPPHIHVISDDRVAVFRLVPVELRDNWGHTQLEIDRIKRVVVAHQAELLRHWNEFFGE